MDDADKENLIAYPNDPNDEFLVSQIVNLLPPNFLPVLALTLPILRQRTHHLQSSPLLLVHHFLPPLRFRQ